MKEYIPEKKTRPLLVEEMEFFKYRPFPWRTQTTHSHIHEAIECIYVNSGSIEVSIDGVKTSCYPGDLAVFPSGAVHNIFTLDCIENDYYVLKLMPSVLYNISSRDNTSNFALRFIGRSQDSKCVWRKEEIAGTDIELGLNRLIDSLDKKKSISNVSRKISALMVFEGLYTQDPKTEASAVAMDEKFSFARFYINGHYDEPISAEEIAGKVNMSLSSFSRKFKSTVGQSFKDYLNTVRTDRAEKLLINTELSVRDVAISTGYNNISHFIEVYKRYKGKTPLEERRKEDGK